MRKVTYKCDVCKEEKPFTELLTVYWDTGIIPPKYTLITTKPSNDYDKQICHKCIEMIKSLC